MGFQHSFKPFPCLRLGLGLFLVLLLSCIYLFMVHNKEKDSCRGKNGTQMNSMNVPQELIIDIFLRLPVKSLLVCRSVCKSWLSLISDPHFAKSHFELSSARSERLVFLLSAATEFQSIDFNASLHDDSASSPLKFDLVIPNNYYYVFRTICYNVHIIGSCRGFLLLDLNDILCVWNPSTGAHRVVYWSPIQSSTLSFRFSVFLRGFGYDPLTDDYLVILASFNREQRDDRVIRVEFFSFRANSWKEIEGTNWSYKECSLFNENQMGWFLNGAIHWLAFSYGASMNVVLTFDLKERSFSEISLPLDFEYCKFRICLLGVLAESLSLYAVGSNHTAELWIMKEYRVQSSWTKNIVLSYGAVPTRCFHPICYSQNGDMVGTNGRTGLAKFNNKGQLLEHRSYSNEKKASVVAVYTESLFSLPSNEEKAKVYDKQ